MISRESIENVKTICAGFNWEVNHETGYRTTYHCDAYKLSIMASCKLEYIRINQLKEHDFSMMSEEEKNKIRTRLDAIVNIVENGLEIQ